MAKERIETEALRLFALNGYAGTSVRMIVEAAGVTKPALYYHFGSKEGLYVTLLNTHLEGWLELVRSIIAAETPVAERVRAYLDIAIVGALQAPMAVRFVQRAYSQTEEEAPAPPIDFHAEEARLLQQMVEEGMAAGELRQACPRESTLALMAMLHWRAVASLHPDVPLTPEVAKHIAEIWLMGVGT